MQGGTKVHCSDVNSALERCDSHELKEKWGGMTLNVVFQGTSLFY